MINDKCLMIGKLIDRRYKVTKPLSQGAFGHTFLAEDTKRPNNPVCVIKQLKPKQSQPDFLLKAKELFNREAQALESLGKHPQIPCLLAHLEVDGEFYLIEEYIAGQTLEEELEQESKKTEAEVISIINELLNILTLIHAKNIIHRDIKPSNIIRHEVDNKLVLIDFGAVMEFAEETVFGTIIGTPGYIAPEQSQGTTGFYSDIYAVGIIGIQALTGINPNLLDKDSSDEIIWQDKVAISQELKDILTKMVRTDKDERYKDGREALDDIEKIAVKTNRLPGFFKLKNILISFTILATMPLFWWLSTKPSKTSSLNLPLNGKVITNELTEENLCREMILEQDIYCQEYTLTGKENQQLILEMNSDDFDPLLVLQKPNGDKLKLNSDRSIDNWNAQIKAKLPSDGKYTVITRTTSPGESGQYTIRARLVDE